MQIELESSEMNPFISDQLIDDNVAQTIQWGKNSFFNKWNWKKKRQPHTKESNWTPILHHTQKSIQNGLNTRPDDLKP